MSPTLNTNDLHRIFENLDKNKDGLVSLEELNWLLETIGVQLSREELIESLEVGKSSLDFNEFMFFYDSISTNRDFKKKNEDEECEDDLDKAFRVFDLNGDGFISCKELEIVLVRLGVWDGQDCTTMINVYDTNSDGLLDFDEFKNMMYISV